MTEDSVKDIEADESVSIDDDYIRLKDGRVVKKTQRCFTYRSGTGSDGSAVRVDMGGKVYVVGPGGALFNQEPKLSKADKKLRKRMIRDSRREVECGVY